MSFRSKGLVLSMEDDAPVVQVEINAEQEVPAEVEAADAELGEAVSETDDLTAAIEDAETGADTIEQIGEVFEESAEKGEGVDPVTAEVAEIAVESICARLGIRNPKIVPSLESFGGTGQRVTATRISVENFKETWTRIWNAIKAAFKQAWEAIKGFFAKLFVANERLKATAKKMLEASKKITGSPTETGFPAGSLAKAFPKAAVVNADAVTKSLEAHQKVTNVVVGYADNIETTMGDLQSVVDGALKATDKKAAANDVNKAVDTFITKIVSSAQGVLTKGDGGLGNLVKAGANGEVFTSEALCGDQYLVLTRMEGGADSATYFHAQVVSKDFDSKREIAAKAATAAEMGSICDGVIALCDATGNLKAKASKIGNIEKKFDALINSAVKTAAQIDSEQKGAAKDEEVVAVMKIARNAISGLGKSSTTVMTSVPRITMAAAKAALSFVSTSMKQYKESK